MMRRLLAERSASSARRRPGRRARDPVAARRRLLSEVMRPAETTDLWARSPNERGDRGRRAATASPWSEAADEREEALAIAVALRETLDSPAEPPRSVTPDRALARRVAAEFAAGASTSRIQRGHRLAETPAGRLARLAAEAAAPAFHPGRSWRCSRIPP